MTIEETLDYCYNHENEYKRDMYDCGQDGEEQFDCLISLVEDGTVKFEQLADYGMDYK